MKTPDLPENEQQRLDNLSSYQILDTLGENAYDDLVRLTASICDMPIVAISLIDSSRQWFKAIKGLSVSETPRDISFCGHAILTPEDMFVIEDATLDARFSDNPLVTGDPKIRFYAGMPLVSEAGYALGTLCLIDRKPRTLSSAQKTSLATLAACVMNLVENRKKIQELEAQQQKLCDSFQEKEIFLQKLMQKNKELEIFSKATIKDIKEPLDKMHHHGTLLKQENLSAQALEHLEVMQNAAIISQKMLKELQSLIEPEILTKERFEIIDMNKLIKNMAVYFQGQMQNEKMQISFGILPKIYSHLASVTGIFHHLIHNAIKFHPVGQMPKIQIMADKKDDFWKFSIIDNGIGIKAEHFESIFQPFIKLDDQIEGAGIGLTLAEKYCQSLEGKIIVDSTNKGSVFSVFLSNKLP